MSHSRATTSYTQPAPQQHAYEPTWPAQQYSRQMPRFIAPIAPLVYYVPPMQASPSLGPAPSAPMGQVFTQQNRPNQPTPNNQQGQGRNNRARNSGNNQPQGGGPQPNPANNTGENWLAQNPQQPNPPRRNTPLRTNQSCNP